MTQLNGLSIDVEEWWHLLNLPTTPQPEVWDSLPSTVERNTRRLLELLGEAEARGTFFVLGWVARRHPALVKAIAAAGHEVACHGDMHELVYEQGEKRFRDDLRRARAALEDLVSAPVWGYRAPGFSILRDTPWAFDCIHAAGFRYDSSVFPAARQHGGIAAAPTHPYEIELEGGQRLVEFPMTVVRYGPVKIPFSGGGYLRLFPYPLVRSWIRRVNRSGDPACVYLHPREIDPGHPRLEMSAGRRFRSYVNLRSTEPKLRRLIRDFRFAPLAEVLQRCGLLDS